MVRARWEVWEMKFREAEEDDGGTARVVVVVKVVVLSRLGMPFSLYEV